MIGQKTTDIERVKTWLRLRGIQRRRLGAHLGLLLLQGGQLLLEHKLLVLCI